MSNVSVEIPDFSRKDFLFVVDQNNCTKTTLVVRPPIVIGELFEETILGERPLEISLKHIISTEGTTVLEAKIGRTRDNQERVQTLKEIASRITALAALPQEATSMSVECPFTERWVW